LYANKDERSTTPTRTDTLDIEIADLVVPHAPGVMINVGHRQFYACAVVNQPFFWFTAERIDRESQA
jgi:hypothetical protein